MEISSCGTANRLNRTSSSRPGQIVSWSEISSPTGESPLPCPCRRARFYYQNKLSPTPRYFLLDINSFWDIIPKNGNSDFTSPIGGSHHPAASPGSPSSAERRLVWDIFRSCQAGLRGWGNGRVRDSRPENGQATRNHP